MALPRKPNSISELGSAPGPEVMQPAIERHEQRLPPEPAESSASRIKTMVQPEPTSGEPTAPSQAGAPADPTVVEIKKVLGQGLGPAYYQMDPQHQQHFLAEEETAALKIKMMLVTGRIRAKKIFKIVFNWLRLIPLVSTFFLKQEAKIKTDRILQLKDKQ